eukprot:6197309-Pleurochrysis_carterae.AAC.1
MVVQVLQPIQNLPTPLLHHLALDTLRLGDVPVEMMTTRSALPRTPVHITQTARDGVHVLNMPWTSG